MPEDFSNLFGFNLGPAIEDKEVTLSISESIESNTMEIRFSNPEGWIKIHKDGSVELSKGINFDEAAQRFWECISYYGSDSSLEEWKKRIRELRMKLYNLEATAALQNSIIKSLEKKIEELEFKGPAIYTDKFDLED